MPPIGTSPCRYLEMRLVVRQGVDALLEVSKLAAPRLNCLAGSVLFARNGSRMVPTVTLVMLAQAETVAAPV